MGTKIKAYCEKLVRLDNPGVQTVYVYIVTVNLAIVRCGYDTKYQTVQKS